MLSYRTASRRPAGLWTGFQQYNRGHSGHGSPEGVRTSMVSAVILFPGMDRPSLLATGTLRAGGVGLAEETLLGLAAPSDGLKPDVEPVGAPTRPPMRNSTGSALARSAAAGGRPSPARDGARDDVRGPTPPESGEDDELDDGRRQLERPSHSSAGSSSVAGAKELGRAWSGVFAGRPPVTAAAGCMPFHAWCSCGRLNAAMGRQGSQPLVGPSSAASRRLTSVSTLHVGGRRHCLTLGQDVSGGRVTVVELHRWPRNARRKRPCSVHAQGGQRGDGLP